MMVMKQPSITSKEMKDENNVNKDDTTLPHTTLGPLSHTSEDKEEEYKGKAKERVNSNRPACG